MNKKRTLAFSCALLLFFNLFMMITLSVILFKEKRVIRQSIESDKNLGNHSNLEYSMSEDCSEIYLEVEFIPESQTLEVYYDDNLVKKDKVRSGDVVVVEMKEEVDFIKVKLIYDKDNSAKFTFNKPYCQPKILEESDEKVFKKFELTEEQKKVSEDWIKYSSKFYGFSFFYPEIWDLTVRMGDDNFESQVGLINLDYDDPEVSQIDLPGPGDEDHKLSDYDVDIGVERYDKDSFESSIESLDLKLENKDGDIFFMGEAGCTPSSGPSYTAYSTDGKYIYSISYCSLASENVEKVVEEVYYPLIYNFEY